MEEIKEKNAWLSSMQKYKKKGKDESALKAGKVSMKGLLEDYGNLPDRIFISNGPEKPSAKPQKPEENPLQGGAAKAIIEEATKKKRENSISFY